MLQSQTQIFWKQLFAKEFPKLSTLLDTKYSSIKILYQHFYQEAYELKFHEKSLMAQEFMFVVCHGDYETLKGVSFTDQDVTQDSEEIFSIIRSVVKQASVKGNQEKLNYLYTLAQETIVSQVNNYSEQPGNQRLLAQSIEFAVLCNQSVDSLKALLVEFRHSQHDDIGYADGFYHHLINELVISGHNKKIQLLVSELQIDLVRLHQAETILTLPIHQAAIQGNIDLVKYFISKDVDVYCRNLSAWNTLHFTIKKGALSLLTNLVEDVLKNPIPKLVLTDLLQFAADSTAWDSVVYLCEKINPQLSAELAVLSSTQARVEFMQAVVMLSPITMELFAKEDASESVIAARRLVNINFYEILPQLDLLTIRYLYAIGCRFDTYDSVGNSLLSVIVSNQDKNALAYLLENDERLKGNLAGFLEANVMWPAAECGAWEIVYYCICKGVRTNTTDIKGKTLLFYAMTQGATEAVGLLTQRNPELIHLGHVMFALNNRQTTIARIFLEREVTKTSITQVKYHLIIQAIEDGDFATVRYLIENHYVEVNYRVLTTGMHLLHIAALGKDVLIFQYFLEHKDIDLSVADNQGYTVAYYLAHYPNPDMLAVWQNKKSNQSVNLISVPNNTAKQTDPSLLSPISAQEISSQKSILLKALKSEIADAKTIQAVFQVFIKVKNDMTSMLRKHQKNIVYNYGDTDSYKEVIALLYETAFTMLQNSNHFDDCDKLRQMYDEAKRCGKTTKETLSQLKACSLTVLKREVSSQQDIGAILALFIQLSEPANILRYHQKNILYSQGKTESYKQALLAIANKTKEFGLIHDTSLRQQIESLRNELISCQPKLLNSEWSEAIQGLQRCLSRPDQQKNYNFVLSRTG